MPGSSRGHKTPNSSEERNPSAIDQAIAAIATSAQGRITSAQLRDLGLSWNQIAYRARIGRLHRVARGVYSVGHVNDGPQARWLTAVLRIGPGAVLSRGPAAGHWGIRPYSSATIDVTYPRRHRPVPGIRLHRTALPADEITIHNQIPITTVPRTLLDLATFLSPGQLERALGEAERLGLTNALSLPDLVERYPGRRGVGRLQALLQRSQGGLRVTRSELEALFLDLLDGTDLPPPLTNHLVTTPEARFECDFVWPSSRLIVELDGYAYHGGRRASDRDRLRDRVLTVHGWTVIRVTWDHLHSGRAALRADLQGLIYTHASRRRSSVGRALHS